VTVLNAKNRPFSWSYSSLTDFEGCPARFAAKKFFCTTREAPTEQTVWGERVHKSFEERIRDGKPFDSGLEMYEPWARVLEKLPGEKFFERQFAVKPNHQPCSWFEGTGRGVVDLLILHEGVATIIDYKTGKKKDDQTQLELFSWFVVNEFDFDRQFRTVKSRYIWLKYAGLTPEQLAEQKVEVTTKKELSYLDAKLVMNKMLPRIEAMERAWNAEEFPCFPSGLCGWCPVEECTHWRPRKEWR
jgi:RecB family exonuclease